jgi:hypothetical protein
MIVAGEYPVDMKSANREVHVSGYLGNRTGAVRDVDTGKQTGLYHLILGEGQNAVVGNGISAESVLCSTQ